MWPRPNHYISNRYIPDRCIPDHHIPNHCAPDRYIPGHYIPNHCIPDRHIANHYIYGRSGQNRVSLVPRWWMGALCDDR